MSHADASATTCGDAGTWNDAVICLVFGGLLSAWSLLALGGAFRSFVEENRLREEGVITTAVVVTGREEYRDDLHVTHFLSLAYKAPSGPGQPERSFLREIEVSPKYYRDLPAGSAVPLRYIRTDPAVSRLEHHAGISRLNAGFVAISTVPLGMGGVLVLSGIQCCSQLIQLACFGRSIPGQVVNCWTKTVCEMGLVEEDYEIQHYVSYVFQPPNGPAQLVVEKHVSADVYKGLRPGSRVLVEFVPQRPAIHRLVLR
jgi:hypothetical protein